MSATSRLPIVLAIACLAVAGRPTPVRADDTVVNTPGVLAALKGRWELRPEARDAFKQRLSFDGTSCCGYWQRSNETLPMNITFYIEGTELLLQYYHEPNLVNNYRMRQIRFNYKLSGETLILKRGGVTETWKRVGETFSR